MMGGGFAFQSPHHKQQHSQTSAKVLPPPHPPPATSSSNDPLQQQQPQATSKSVGRNLSAMLDENNTVVCYLEPMANHQ